MDYSALFDATQTSDHSFQACKAGQNPNAGAFSVAPTITAYVDGVLASGIEPM